MDFIIISKDSMVANKLSYGVTVTPFLCRPLERDSELSIENLFTYVIWHFYLILWHQVIT